MSRGPRYTLRKVRIQHAAAVRAKAGPKGCDIVSVSPPSPPACRSRPLPPYSGMRICGPESAYRIRIR